MTLKIDKSSWERVVFSDLIDSITDRVDDPSAAGVDRYVGLEHLDPGVLTVRRWDTPDKVSAQKLRFRSGDVIFGRRRAYQKKVALAEFDGICSAHALVLRARPGRIEPSFLPVFLSSDYFLDRAVTISVGSLSPTVNWRDLKTQEFLLPPLDEQRRIANLLWALERHRRTLTDSYGAVTGFRRAWFTESLATPRHHSWAEVPVSDLVLSGPTNGKSGKANDEGRGVPTLSISAIRDGKVRGGSAVKYMDVDPATVSQFVIQDDDVFIVRGNGNRKLTGRAGLATGDLPPGCVYPDLLIRLRFNNAEILPMFAVEQWNTHAVHAKLIQRAKSTNGIWKINGQDIKSHKLVIPPISKQEEILSRLQFIKKAENTLLDEEKTLTKLRTTLLTSFLGDE